MAERTALSQARRWLAVDLLFWSAVALIFALQGHFLSLYRGTPQLWWPSFGYSLAIFSVWALLSPAIVLAVRRAELRFSRRWRLAAACVAGLPAVALLHVVLFALLYWPIYNGDGAIPSRRAMAERMALPNLDTNVLLYAILVGGTLAWTARVRRVAGKSSQAASGAATQQLQPLQVRSRGRLQLISTADVDWIGSADDYVEVHAGGAVHLMDTSLAALERRLPTSQFARIHRRALVRLDRVSEVRSLGRGDALIILRDGSELRLSRRYRANLALLLERPAGGDPVHPSNGSRLPINGGGTG